MSKELKGLTFAVLSAAFFGIIPILTIYVYQEGVSIYLLLFLRFSIAFILLITYMLCKYNKVIINKEKIIRLLIINGGFYTVFSLCFFTAIKLIPVSLAIIIFYTYPIILAIISIIFKNYKLTKKVLILMLMSFLGLSFSLGNQFDTNKIIGVLLAGGSAIFYAFYTLYSTKILKKYSPLEAVTFSCFFSILVFFIKLISNNKINLILSFKTWIIIILISIISFLGFLFFLKALILAKAINVSIVTMCEPVITILLSVILLNESLNCLQIFGIALVIIAVYKIIFNKEKLKEKSIQSVGG